MTNIEFVILGLVAEGPKYGYQIETDIEKRGIREWTEIGFSSIYHILNKLDAQGWLKSEKQAEGVRPMRKVYSLTSSGSKAFHHSVINRLSQPRPHSSDFDLALANLPVLNSLEIFQALEKYRNHLEEKIKWIKNRQKDEVRSETLPHVSILFDHNLALMNLELEWVEKQIERFQRP